MKQFTYVINDAMGIHARPAGLLVKKAAEFKSTVKISNGTKEVDAKRIMGVMSLGMKQGQTASFTIEGEDEELAAQAVEAFMKEYL